jgi:hypothetical protein
MMKLQLDFKEASYIQTPSNGNNSSGYSPQYIQGYKNYVNEGGSVGLTQINGTTALEFFYVACTVSCPSGMSGNCFQLWYYDTTNTGASVPSSCPASWGQTNANSIPLIVSPVIMQEYNGNAFFSRAGTTSGGYDSMSVAFEVEYPPMPGAPNAPPMRVEMSSIPINASFVSP